MYREGTYYWFAAGYAACREFNSTTGCKGCLQRGVPIGPACGCGFEASTAVNLYTSRDLVAWQFHGNVLPAAARPTDRSLFSPRAIYNERAQRWVLWWNYVPSYSYAVAVAASPFGPFGQTNASAGDSFRYCHGNNSRCGDFSLFVDDDGAAYMLYSHDPLPGTSDKLSVARLTDDYLASAWDPRTGTGEMALGIPGFEAPALFKRGQQYVALTSSACCYCQPGGTVYAHQAAHPLGPYTPQTPNVISFSDGSLTRTQGQQTTVTTVQHTPNATWFLWQGDRWQSAPDGLKAHDFQFWYPLAFAPNGSILPMAWVDSFSPPTS